MKLSRMVRTGNPVGPGWSGYVPPAEMLRTFETMAAAGTPPLAALRAEGSDIFDAAGTAYYKKLAGAWRNLINLGTLYGSSNDLYDLIAITGQANCPANLLAMMDEYDSGGLDIREKYTRIGRTLAGITDPVAVCFDDHAPTATDGIALGGRLTAGTGTITQSTTRQTSVVLSSGATAGSYAVINPVGTSAFFPAGYLGRRFYLACRLTRETVADAQSAMALRLHDSVGGNQIQVGVLGAVSTVNYGAQSGAGSLDLGIPLGTTAVVEMYRAAANVFFRVNGVAAGSLAMPGACAGRGYHNLAVFNGTTAANRSASFDWHIAITEAGQ